MLRAPSVLFAISAGSLLASSPLSAQLDPPDFPPVTWCDKPAPAPVWKRQTVSFMLEIPAGDSSEAQQRLKPYLPLLLSGIAERYVAEHQPLRDIKYVPAAQPGLDVEKTTGLPPGEPQYGPGDLARSFVSFDLLGKGTIDSVKVIDTTGSPLAADLKAALFAAAASGEVFGPYADSTARTRLSLVAGADDFTVTATVRWPAFTLYAPISRPAVADPKNRPPSYPNSARDWNASLLFQYLVDENGRAVPGSVTVPGADKIVWESSRHRRAYEKFRREVERTLPRMRFRPAEINGCFATTWVQQEFVFEH